MKANELLLFLSNKFEGDWQKIFNFIKAKESPPTNEEIQDVINRTKFDYISLISNDYPELFKQVLNTPPFIVYYQGDIKLLNKEFKKLTVIGSRISSLYARNLTDKLVKELPNDVVIISGLAKGIDSCGIKAALYSNKKVIAVLGNGIGRCYPHENEQIYKDILENGGLILSEYPYGTEPKQENFRWRNRIIAALGDSIFVAEAKYNSGTRITVNYGLNYGKSVGCLPFRCDEESYCNLLIKQGAEMIENINDLKSLLNIPIKI